MNTETIPKPGINQWVRALVYALLFAVLYLSVYQVMLKWWRREDYNYCYLIPFVVIYLLWEKRDALKCTPSNATWVGFFPLLFGVGLFWLGELGGEYYTMYLSSWFVLVSLCWLHMGWHKLKTILFPLAFILTMFPPPNFVYFNLSLKLKLISSRLGVWVLQSLGKTAYREGNIIDLGFTQLQVVDACNGLRYLFPLIVLAILVVYFSKSAMWKKVLLVLSAIPISIFVNGLRIASVGLLYPIWGPQVAEGFFHDFSGWAIFIISLGLLLGELWLLNRLFRENQKLDNSKLDNSNRISKLKARRPDQKYENEKLENNENAKHWGLFKPQFIAAILLLGVTTAIAQTVNFREEVPIAKSFHQFPLQLGDWHGQLESMEQKFIDQLDLSDYIIANFRNASGKPINFYAVYYESQRKGESIHSPSSCLPGSGWEFRQTGRVDIPMSPPSTSSIYVNRAVMRNLGLNQLSYYWFPMRGRVATNLWQVKLYNFWDALTRQRTDGALVRLITPIGSNEQVADADARLQAFTRELVPVLDHFLPQ